MLAEIFKTVVIMSAVGGLLAMVVLLLKPVMERFCGFKWQYCMWFAVLLVMICPLKIKSEVELPEPISQGVQNITMREISPVSVFEDSTGVYMSKPEEENTIVSAEWLGIAAGIWLAVATILFLKIIVSDLLLKHRLLDNSVYKGKLGRAEVRECMDIGAPMLIGVLKPILYIPGEIWESPCMEYISAHEKVHVRRFDVCIKWIAAFVRCVHWFNPLVYIASKQMDLACEVSCDGAATKGMNDAQKNGYMQTILEISEHEIAFKGALSAGLSSGGRCMKKRFGEIRKHPQNGWLRGAVGIVIIFALTGYSAYAVGIIRGSDVVLEEPKELFLVVAKNAGLVSDDVTTDKPEKKAESETLVESNENLDEQSSKDISEAEFDIENGALTEQQEQSRRDEAESSEKVDASENKTTQKTPVFRGEFNSEGGDSRQICGVTADENGRITVGIRSNTQETVDVYISDAESNKPIHSMGVPVPYEAAYVMEGLEPGKKYDIVLKGEMRNDWNIESEYVIY